VLLAACYRSDELPRDHRLRPVRAELRRRQRLAEISLAPLDAAAVRAMLAALLGAAPEQGLAAAVTDRADGIPFAVQELTFALRDSGRLTYHDSAPPAYYADGRDQLFRGPVLQQEAARPGAERVVDVLVQVERGEDQDPGRRVVRGQGRVASHRKTAAYRAVLLEARRWPTLEFDVDLAAELAYCPDGRTCWPELAWLPRRPAPGLPSGTR
jgi:hypothetical protein